MLFTWSLPLSPLQAGCGQPDVHQIQGGVWEALHETLHQQPPVCIHPAEPEAGRGGSAQRDCHSLPLWVSLPCTHRELPCEVPALPRLGSAALGRTGTTDAVGFHCQRDNLFWWPAWRMSGAGFSSHWINSWVYHTDKAASSMGRDREQHGLTQTSGSRKQKFLHSQRTQKSPQQEPGCLYPLDYNPPQSSFMCVPQGRFQCSSQPAQPLHSRGNWEGISAFKHSLWSCARYYVHAVSQA